MYCCPSGAASLKGLPAATCSVPLRFTLLTVTAQSSFSIVVPSGNGVSRVSPAAEEPGSEAPGSGDAESAEGTSLDTVVSPPVASENDSPTTATKTITAMIVPTIDEITAAIAVPFFLSLPKSPTRPKMKAMGSRTHPIMSAPFTHEKMMPRMATTSAMIPIMLRLPVGCTTSDACDAGEIG